MTLPKPENFNLQYSYDENLQEIPDDIDSVKAFADQCLAWINLEMKKPESDWNIELLTKTLGLTAGHYKQLCELDQALELIQSCLSLVEQHDLGVKQFVVQSIRWADIVRYLGDYGQAEEILLDILEITEDQPEVFDYQDFVNQHLGKLYFDTEDFQLAKEHFNLALEKRKIKADVELLDSTNFALNVLRQRTQN